MQQVSTYKTASRQLLKQARDELAGGDARQASEKGWGAAAQMLKALAQQRGWDHHRHVNLRRVVGRLAEETGDVEIRRYFRVADSLHINFYEDLDDVNDVAAALDDVAYFLDKLDPLIG